MHKQHAIIVGAGLMGLTAAYILLKRTDIRPIVLERENFVGGSSRTTNFCGNLLEVDERKIFLTDEKNLSLWRELLPDDLSELQGASAVLCRGKIFPLPLTPNRATLMSFGLLEAVSIGASLLRTKFFRREERTLEDVLINRFGKKFYEIFFGDCTTKIFGRSPAQLNAKLGNQLFDKFTLPEKFFCPKCGGGRLCEKLADEIKRLGGEVLNGVEVKNFRADANKIIKSVTAATAAGTLTFPADLFLSSMPLDELADMFDEKILPAEPRELLKNLPYRARITVGLLAEKILPETQAQVIYIREPSVKLARVKIFNNLSPQLVSAEKNLTWLGLDYFCSADDELLNLTDDDFVKFAADELATVGLIAAADVRGGVCVKIPKYSFDFRADKNFSELRGVFDATKNFRCLQLGVDNE